MKVSLALSGQGPHTGCPACHTSTQMGTVLTLHTVMEVEFRNSTPRKFNKEIKQGIFTLKHKIHLHYTYKFLFYLKITHCVSFTKINLLMVYRETPLLMPEPDSECKIRE